MLKRTKIGLIIGLVAALAAAPVVSQMIYGNSFPNWTVRGPLIAETLAVSGDTALAGNLTVTGTQTVTGVQTFTAAPVLSALTASLPVVTNGSKALASATVTGTGTTIVMSASPTLTGTLTTPILNLTTSATPLAADACTAGRIVWGADYIYVCTATGVWKRAALTGGY